MASISLTFCATASSLLAVDFIHSGKEENPPPVALYHGHSGPSGEKIRHWGKQIWRNTEPKKLPKFSTRAGKSGGRKSCRGGGVDSALQAKMRWWGVSIARQRGLELQRFSQFLSKASLFRRVCRRTVQILLIYIYLFIYLSKLGMFFPVLP